MRSAEPSAATLEVGLLGPALVTSLRTGETVRASAARTLLAVLAATGRQMSPESLSAALWPERAPGSPVAALRTVAWRARKIVGTELIATDADGSYRLDAEQCEIDIARFRDRLTRARALQGVDRPGEALAALDEAVDLWRGPALADWSGARWTVPLVAEWSELLIGAREERAALRFEAGDRARAESELVDICARYPDREHAWALLVTNLDAIGRPGDARHTYDRARQHLAKYGLEPGAELRAAVEQLGRPGAGRGVQRVDLGSRRLVGRDKEAGVIGAAITDSIATRRSRLVLIEGEAGIGKTLLSRAVVARVQSDRRVLAWFTACDPNLNLPYAPLVSLLRALRPAGESPLADTSLQIDWLQGRAGSELSHWQVREQFAELLARAAGRAEAEVVVLVIDDVQWAPALSLDVFTHLLAQPSAVPVVVLATHRTHGDQGADAAMDDMQRRVWVEKVDLAGLTQDESVQLFLEVGGASAQADQVWQLTGGNPLYVHELGRGDPALSGVGGRVASTPSLQRAVAARIDELPPDTEGVLALAAIIGAQFDELLLGAAATNAELDGVTIDPARVVDAVLAAIRAGLVVPVDRAPHRWSFRHDLVRQALILGLQGQARAQAHLAVARAMQRLAVHRPPPVEQLAHHLRNAWPLCPADEAATHLLAAAETPVALLDPRVSADLCLQGLDVLALDHEPNVELHRRLLITRGTALADAGELDGARQCLLSAIRPLSAEGGNPDLFSLAVEAYVDTWRDRTLPDDAAQLLAAVASGEEFGLTAARCQSVAMLHAVDAELASSLVPRLVDQARRAGDVVGERTLHVATWRWRDAASRRISAAALTDLAAATGSAAIAADAAVREAITAAQIGEALVIPATSGPGAPVVRAPRNAAEALTVIWSITVHTATGWFDHAREEIVRAAPRIAELAALTDSRPVRIATLLLRQSIQLATFTGRSADAALLGSVVNLAEVPIDLDSGAINTVIRGRRGDTAGALAACTALVEQAEPVLMPDRVAEYSSLATACVETGYRHGVAASVTRLEPVVDQHIVRGEHLYLGPVRHRLGQLAVEQARPAEAAEYFAGAALQCAAIGARPWEVRADLARADVLRSTGDDAAARRLTDQAEALAASMGMAARNKVGDFLPEPKRRTS